MCDAASRKVRLSRLSLDAHRSVKELVFRGVVLALVIGCNALDVFADENVGTEHTWDSTLSSSPNIVLKLRCSRGSRHPLPRLILVKGWHGAHATNTSVCCGPGNLQAGVPGPRPLCLRQVSPRAAWAEITVYEHYVTLPGMTMCWQYTINTRWGVLELLGMLRGNVDVSAKDPMKDM